MPTLTIALDNTTPEYVGQLGYALTFLSEDVVSYDVNESDGKVTIEFRSGTDGAELRRRVDQLLERYKKSEFGSKSVVYLDQRRELPIVDAWTELLGRRWVTPVGEGHVILRGVAAQLLALVDHKVESLFAKEFAAELEIFPPTIRSQTLHRCNHFTSFPEHMDFVAHLRQDLTVLSAFSGTCKDEGWSPKLHEGKMGDPDFAISPSCCYHAYEGMEGWELTKPGRCITAVLNCHRYEGANHRSLSRLRSFTMREVVWVGQPAYVIASRARAEELIKEWARHWELSCTLETANDMFFTDDFAVKASFQRQQEAKRELRMEIPFDKNSISVFSSNFHASTFGKAFSISVGGKPAVSGCIGWGYERWVFALLSQFGFDPARWPSGLRADYDAFVAGASR